MEGAILTLLFKSLGASVHLYIVICQLILELVLENIKYTIAFEIVLE